MCFPFPVLHYVTIKDEKAPEGHKHYAPAVWHQNFRYAADPLPRGMGWPKFNQLEMVTTFTYKPSLLMIDGCNFELSW